jgi:hypothetical protein
MSRYMRWTVALVVGDFSLTAVAVAGGGPSTRPAMADFHVDENVAKHKEKNCTNTNGDLYRDVKAEYTGPINSSEPALNGVITIRGDALVNVTQELGITTGKWEVRDSSTNEKTAEGDFVATNSSFAGGVLKGVFTGHLPGTGGDLLVANFTSEFDSPTSADGELGGDDNVGGSSATETGKDPAVIQQGHC